MKAWGEVVNTIKDLIAKTDVKIQEVVSDQNDFCSYGVDLFRFSMKTILKKWL